MTSKIEHFFNQNPWAAIKEPIYPSGRRLYLQDDRFWVSIDENQRLLFFVQDQGGHSFKTLENIAGLDISLERMGNGETRLVCTLTNADMEIQSKFSTVAKDIAFHCSPYRGEAFFRKIQDRIKSWANFLKPSRTGLSSREFVGLFGELYVMQMQLFPCFSSAEVINGWIGPEEKKQDFSIGARAFEIKASLAGDSQEISVSSLDQLDQVTEELFLLRVVGAPAAEGSGLSLEELYEKILEAVSNDFILESKFLSKVTLLYGKASSDQLAQKYVIVDEAIYGVEDDFPCLTRGIVDPHIRDASYKISVSGIERFRRGSTLSEVLQ